MIAAKATAVAIKANLAI